MIIDTHVHVGVDADGESQELAALERSMSESGIERAVVFPFNDRSDVLIERSEQLRASVAHDDRFIPLIRFDPKSANENEVRRVIAGYAGIKLHPNAQDFDIEDPEVLWVYELAHELELPILFHTKASQPQSHPLKAIAIAERYPRIKVILGHFFGDSFEAMERTRDVPNVYAETSIFGRSLRIKQLVREGFDRLLFGSDSPYDDQLAALLTVTRSGLDPDELAPILNGNAMRVFGR